MFSAHDILDIAIRLEKNGEKTYLDARQHTSNEALRNLLDWMAREEQSHARWFDTLKSGLALNENDHLMAQFSRALAEDVIQEQNFSLQEVDFSTIDTLEKMVKTFIGFEADTIAFYEALAAFVDDPAITRQLNRIITEEKAHIDQFRKLLANGE